MHDDQEIRAKRDSAARARRLAKGIVNPEDNARLLAYANELTEQADTLERRQWADKGRKTRGPTGQS
jgi:hypothetical protein